MSGSAFVEKSSRMVLEDVTWKIRVANDLALLVLADGGDGWYEGYEIRVADHLKQSADIYVRWGYLKKIYEGEYKITHKGAKILNEMLNLTRNSN